MFALPKLSSIGGYRGILGHLFKMLGTYSRYLEVNFEKYTGHKTTNEMGFDRASEYDWIKRFSYWVKGPFIKNSFTSLQIFFAFVLIICGVSLINLLDSTSFRRLKIYLMKYKGNISGLAALARQFIL